MIYWSERHKAIITNHNIMSKERISSEKMLLLGTDRIHISDATESFLEGRNMSSLNVILANALLLGIPVLDSRTK